MKAKILTTDFSAAGRERKNFSYKNQNRWTTAVLLGSAVSVLTGVPGIVIDCLALSGLLKNNPHLGNLGVWLTVLTFPLAALTAHYLDKAEEAKSAARRASRRRRIAINKNYRQFNRSRKIISSHLIENPARRIFSYHG